MENKRRVDMIERIDENTKGGVELAIRYAPTSFQPIYTKYEFYPQLSNYWSNRLCPQSTYTK